MTRIPYRKDMNSQLKMEGKQFMVMSSAVQQILKDSISGEVLKKELVGRARSVSTATAYLKTSKPNLLRKSLPHDHLLLMNNNVMTLKMLQLFCWFHGSDLHDTCIIYGVF